MSQYQTFFISASGNSSQCDEINHFLRSHVAICTVENIINSGSNSFVKIPYELVWIVNSSKFLLVFIASAAAF